MGKVYERIGARLHDWLLAQPVFVVATAPGEGGHVNASPKGMAGTFAILDETTVAYLDYTGSGAETIAHLRDNGRITLMFCAFDGPPNVVRLHGRGRFVTVYDDGFADLLSLFDEHRGARAVVIVDVERVSDSCGYGVPLLAHVGERHLLPEHMERKGEAGQVEYRRRKNTVSIDGLAAFDYDAPAPTDTG
jgi:hypothetical protein